MPNNGESRKQSGGFYHMRKSSLQLSVLLISEAISASLISLLIRLKTIACGCAPGL
jgi:hypothetical protein